MWSVRKFILSRLKSTIHVVANMIKYTIIILTELADVFVYANKCNELLIAANDFYPKQADVLPSNNQILCLCNDIT